VSTTEKKPPPKAVMDRLAKVADMLERNRAKTEELVRERDNILADTYLTYDVDMPTLAEVGRVKKQWVHKVVSDRRTALDQLATIRKNLNKD
jgi:hypothetical protein